MNNYPFLFNILKHHLKSIKTLIIQQKINLPDDLSIIGNSVTDIYTGNLSVESIFSEIHESLQSNEINNKNKYETWLKLNNNYQIVSISDGSKWILRLSKDNEKQYIHIHPGRYAVNTLRIKSESLKTAISFVYLNHINNFHTGSIPLNLQYSNKQIIYNTHNINQIRKFLQLSPIKSLESCSVLLRLISILKLI